MKVLARQQFDLSSGAAVMTGVGNALGYQIAFDVDLNGNATGTVACNENDNYLPFATVKAKTLRTGALSGQGSPNTKIALTPSAGAEGLITIELVDEPQPAATYAL